MDQEKANSDSDSETYSDVIKDYDGSTSSSWCVMITNEKSETCTTVSDDGDSDDDSLGLLTDEQLDSAWYEDSATEEEIIPSFKELLSEYKGKDNDLTKTCYLQDSKQNIEEISPIGGREKKNINLSVLESTPKIKQSSSEIIEKKYFLKSDDILNKTVKISKSDISDKKSEESENLEYDNLNVTHEIQKDHDANSPLNKTFDKHITLNITLPSIPVEAHSNLNLEDVGKNLLNRTFTEAEGRNITNKTFTEEDEKNAANKTFAERGKGTVTKKKQTNKPVSDLHLSSTTLDSEKSLYPQSSISETDSLFTGTKRKTFKYKQAKKSSNVDAVKNKPRKVLRSANRELGSSSACDTNTTMSSKYIDSKVTVNPTTISRGNVTSKRDSPKKTPIKISFKNIEWQSPEDSDKMKREEMIIKNEREVRKAKKVPFYKLPEYKAAKELEKVKSGREMVVVTPLIPEDPFAAEQRRNQRTFSRLPQRSQISRPIPRSQGNRPVPCRESASPMHQRLPFESGLDHINPPSLPQRISERSSLSSRGRPSRIPTFGRAFGPQAIFTTENPFERPALGRSSTIPRRSIFKKKPSEDKLWTQEL